MRYAEIGHSGIQASAITFGAMGMGAGWQYPDADDATSIAAIHAALDAGINFIDTAPVYGFGHSEEVIGKAIKGRRDQVVISTKCGLWWDDDEGTYRFTWDGHAVRRNLSARTIRIELERSLRLLDTDYIDVYYTHNPAMPPFNTPIEETIGVLNEFVREGKVRAIGVSNCEVHHAQSYLDRGELSIIQRKFNIIDNAVENDILPFAKEHGLSFHGYSTLEKGLLAGTIPRDFVPPAADARTDQGTLWTQPATARAVDFADTLTREVAEPLGLSLAELAVAWSIAKGVNPIVGIRKPAHVDAVVGGADAELSPDVIAEVDSRAQLLRDELSQLG